eukprot:scaffold25496_cov80-Skeletonema_dohrnii-CCMP3373.AAC.2
MVDSFLGAHFQVDGEQALHRLPLNTAGLQLILKRQGWSNLFLSIILPPKNEAVGGGVIPAHYEPQAGRLDLVQRGLCAARHCIEHQCRSCEPYIIAVGPFLRRMSYRTGKHCKYHIASSQTIPFVGLRESRPFFGLFENDFGLL